jgi:hypothetical protein
MLIDKYSTLGENLSLESAEVIGNAIDLGAAYNIGAGANRPPVLHIVAATEIKAAGTLQLCTSTDGTTAGDVLMSIPFAASEDGEVLFSGIMPTIPEASGQYLVLNNGTAVTDGGAVNAYVLNNAPAHHIYPGK